MKLSKTQKFASLMEGRMGENTYIVNRREKGQQRFFKCVCCDKKFDFKDSEDYVGAVKQWEDGGGKCYRCANGFCHCKKKEEQDAISE